MALAETAQLVADLQLKDNLSTPANAAKRSVQGLDDAVETTGTKLSRLSGISARASGAMTHFRNRVGDVTKSIGVLGLGGAALAVGKFLHDSMGDAVAFGAAIDRVSTLTGMATGRTSQFVDALGYYGIGADQAQRITGMYLKNVQALADTKKKATQFEKDYGFSLRDSNGRVRDAADLITSFTRYFNDKTIPMQVKAAAGAKIFGRSWQDLLPIFQQGQREWTRQLEQGLRLTPQQLKRTQELRDAQRQWNDTLGDFKVIVGLQLIPVMTELTKAANNWLSNPDNQRTLFGFLRQGISMGRAFAGFVSGTLLPAMRDIGQAAVSFWNRIPQPLQELLIKGIVADRTIKYLFGFSVTGVAAGAVAGAIKDGLGATVNRFFARGSSPANPLFVSGGIGGGMGGAGGSDPFFFGDGKGAKPSLGRRLIGGAVTAVSVVSFVGAALAVFDQLQTFLASNAQAQADLQAQANAASKQTGREASANIAKLTEHLKGLDVFASTITNTFGSKETGAALVNLSRAIREDKSLGKRELTAAIANLEAAQREAVGRGWTDAATAIGADIAALRERLPTAPEIGQAVADANPKPKPSVDAPDDDSKADRRPVRVKADPRAARDIGTSVSTALAGRFAMLARTIRPGVTAATNTQRLLAQFRAAMAVSQARQLALLARIAAKPTQVTAVTHVQVDTYVASRDVAYRTNVATRYGAQAI